MAIELKFDANQPLPGNGEYVILDRDLRRVGSARPFPRGAVGVVYRAQYKGLLPRAIKFLSPEADGDEQAHLPLDVLTEQFQKETALLAKITHTNIVKIVDFGVIDIDPTKYPYYVMEYIEGERFSNFWPRCEARQFVDVLAEVLDAISYLHSLGYYHMDVKEENVLVRSLASNPHAVLLDLGGAKQVTAPTGFLLSDRTIYVSTAKAARLERRPQLGKLVGRNQIAAWGEDLDLYAVGVMVQRALENQPLRESLAKELTPSGLTALQWIVERLVEGTSETPMTDRHYKSAEQVRTDLRRLFPEYTWPLGLPELSLAVVPDAIQLSDQRVGSTPSLMEVVSHPLFQRLHNIPQLEYVYLIYSGARKSRFEHALSTFQSARLYLSRLLEYPQFRMVATPEYVEATLLAALLHDIGHYALSHMFEDFTSEGVGEGAEVGEGAVRSDEDLFHTLVYARPEDPLAAAAKRAIGSGVEGLEVLLSRRFPKSYRLIGEVLRPARAARPPVPLLHSLVDSAIDVDKLAYLYDDSSATGVRFGHGIDVYGLVQSLVPPRGGDETRGAIAISEDGLAAAESMVLARFWMISRVYWHRTNRAVMAMHKFVIADLLQRGQLKFEDYFEESLFMSHLEATRLLAERYDRANQVGGRAGKVRNPLAGFLNSRRTVYKRLLTVTNGPDTADLQLYQRMTKAGPFGVVTVAEKIREGLKRKFAWLDPLYGDVLVDLPYKERDFLGANVLVYLDRDAGSGRSLWGGDRPVSAVLRELPRDFEHHVKKSRIFVHPEVQERLKSSGVLVEARRIVREFLEDLYQVKN